MNTNNNPKGTILIVDDSPANLKLLLETLHEVGYETVIADSGDHALQQAFQQLPDLILLTVLLPDLDGFEICRRLKENPLTADIPVIFMTAPTDIPGQNQAFEAGAVDYLTKPFQPKEVLARVNAHIVVHTLQQEVEAKNARLQTNTHQLLTTAIEQAAESVLITDTQGSMLYVNPAFERITGYSQAEAIGQTPRILKSGKQDESFYQDLWTTIRAGQTWRGRFINKKKDGTLYTEDAVITPVCDENETIINYVSVQRDITRELQLEEQYYQAQKMEAVGQLAGGVAHDFNNVLTAVMGYVGLSLLTLDPDHPAYSDIQGIQKSVERAADLNRQLLTFARRQFIEPQILSLNDLIFNLDKMLHRFISENIELVTLAEPNLWQIEADPGQIEQVLVNLVINAKDAMPDGGKLILKTVNVTLDEDFVSQYTDVSQGEYVVLTVSDTGIGMTKEVQDHIFEPFFTTKSANKGTGLGLATCFGIVKQSNGHLLFDSEVGQGTTFKIYLPAVKQAVSPTLGRSPFLNLPQGTETILLVEDETSVRMLAARILRERGYTVLEAANGEKAMRLAATNHEPEIHLLLTDIVMPLLGGQELAAQLRDVRPQLKVLFMSGYADKSIINHDTQSLAIAFLKKPFSSSTLAHKVRDVLDGRKDMKKLRDI